MPDIVDIINSVNRQALDESNSLVAANQRNRQMNFEKRKYDEAENRRKLEEATMLANLMQSGFKFNNGQLTRDPNFVGDRQLKTQLLTEKIKQLTDPAYAANRAALLETAKATARAKAYEGMQIPGVGNQLTDGAKPFIFDPIANKLMPNPGYEKPVDKVKRESMQRKSQLEIEAQTNKEDLLRQEAESQLGAIQKAKEGKKYFGVAGKLPSQFAPSSAFGEYAPRKEWENNINKLLAGKVLETMNKMKSASKTGATGFGALNQSELKILQDASTVLSRDLDPATAEKYLSEMEVIYKKVLSGKKGTESKQDFQIMQDANGNRAKVYSDGRIEEI